MLEHPATLHHQEADRAGRAHPSGVPTPGQEDSPPASSWPGRPSQTEADAAGGRVMAGILTGVSAGVPASALQASGNAGLSSSSPQVSSRSGGRVPGPALVLRPCPSQQEGSRRTPDDHPPILSSRREVNAARPVPPAAQPTATTTVRQPDRCAGDAARRRDDDDLDAYIKELIGNAPPLTREQRDKLALLLRPRHRPR